MDDSTHDKDDDKEEEDFDEDEDLDDLDDEALDRLVKLAVAAEPDPHTRPSDEALLGYFDGTATPEQLAEVRLAAIESRSFRAELVELGELLENLDEPDAPDAVTTFKVLECPGWEAFRARYELRSLAGRVLQAVRSLFSSPLVPHHFAPILVRSGDDTLDEKLPGDATTSGRRMATAEQAALRSFRDRVEWTDGAFRVIGPEPMPGEGVSPAPKTPTVASGASPVPPASPPLIRTVLVEDRNRTVRRRVLVNLPADPPTGPPANPPADSPAEARLWVLLLPSLALFSASLDEGEGSAALPIRVSWPEGEVEQACLALTYAVEGGYMALAPPWEEMP